MSASLYIQLCSEMQVEAHEIKFFEIDSWTTDAEQQLVGRIQELLSVTRSLGESFKIDLTIEVNDMNAALFLVRKKINNNIKINNHKLSIREIEVLRLVMQGLTNNEISQKLFISYETVKSHRKNILEKTGAKNTAALINHYHQTFFEK